MDDKMSRVSSPPPYSTNAPEPSPPQATVVTPLIIQTNPAVAVPVLVGQQVGPKPASFVCPSCHAQIVTRVDKKATTKTHLFAALLCLIGFWPCVCIPYCVDSCNNADHYCPNCNAYLGSYTH